MLAKSVGVHGVVNEFLFSEEKKLGFIPSLGVWNPYEAASGSLFYRSTHEARLLADSSRLARPFGSL